MDQSDPRIGRFLALVAWSEGTSTSPITQHAGYDIVVSGQAGPERFDDFSTHPFEQRKPQLIQPARGTRPALYSTAAGRYQLLLRYWQSYRASLRLPDFSPASQDTIAIQQMREMGALAPLLAGDLHQAITKASAIWASMPGNNYGQGGHTMPVLLQQWSCLQTGDTQKVA